MPAALSPLAAAPGPSDAIRGPVSASESKKSLRETPNPLRTLKTAKSRIFRAQRYQRLGKSRDFAGETISFRFRFVWASFFREVPFWDSRGDRQEGLKNLEKRRSSK